MNRYNDISELLLAVRSGIDELDKAYASAAKNEDTKSVLRPLVKSSLEHLRSSLEYCAQDTHDSLFGGKRRLYFPYGKDEKHFNDSVANNLPGLQKRAAHI